MCVCVSAPGGCARAVQAYYRDDSVRDVQDTPLAFAGVALTLLISIGLPICLQMQGKGKKTRRPPAERKDKNADAPAAPHMPRKERRGGEREARESSSHAAPQMADIAAVTTTEDTGSCVCEGCLGCRGRGWGWGASWQGSDLGMMRLWGRELRLECLGAGCACWFAGKCALEARGGRPGSRLCRRAIMRCLPATRAPVGVICSDEDDDDDDDAHDDDDDAGVHNLSNTLNAPRAITKVSGPWSEEEEVSERTHSTIREHIL